MSARSDMPPPFPAEFRAMLEQILRHAGRVDGARAQSLRARNQTLQQSGTFHGHRAYVQGDDLRRIDWSAYARTGSLFLKLLAEEDARAAVVVLDTSLSMGVGVPPRFVTAQRLAAIVCGLALVHLDAVALVANGRSEFEGRRSVGAALDRIEGLALVAGAREPELPTKAAPARVHWISDFVDPEATERSLHRMRRLGARVTGWLPTLPEDFVVEPCGWKSVVDPETGASVPLRIDAELAAAMTRELQALQRQQEQAFARCGFPLQRVTLPTASFEAAAWMEAGWSFRR